MDGEENIMGFSGKGVNRGKADQRVGLTETFRKWDGQIKVDREL
jgi:hypothetical protein